MDRKLIAVGGSWQRWEWYALQQYPQGIAHLGFLASAGDAERDIFYQRAGERSCVPSHWSADEDTKSWIDAQNVIILQVESVSDRKIFEEREVVSALRDFWMKGGTLLASGDAAGLLFSKGIDSEGKIFSGWEFLQGSFSPDRGDHGSSYIKMVQEEGLSAGYYAGQWSGVLFHGRHLQKAVTHDETSAVLRVTEDRVETLEGDLIPY